MSELIVREDLTAGTPLVLREGAAMPKDVIAIAVVIAITLAVLSTRVILRLNAAEE